MNLEAKVDEFVKRFGEKYVWQVDTKLKEFVKGLFGKLLSFEQFLILSKEYFEENEDIVWESLGEFSLEQLLSCQDGLPDYLDKSKFQSILQVKLEEKVNKMISLAKEQFKKKFKELSEQEKDLIFGDSGFIDEDKIYFINDLLK